MKGVQAQADVPFEPGAGGSLKQTSTTEGTEPAREELAKNSPCPPCALQAKDGKKNATGDGEQRGARAEGTGSALRQLGQNPTAFGAPVAPLNP